MTEFAPSTEEAAFGDPDPALGVRRAGSGQVCLSCWPRTCAAATAENAVRQ